MYVIQDKRITTKHAQQLSCFVTGPSNPEVIHYDTNELSVDVNEQVNVLISSKRSVLIAEVLGEVKLKVKVSGDPECVFGFNDRLLFNTNDVGKRALMKHSVETLEPDDIKFHHCTSCEILH